MRPSKPNRLPWLVLACAVVSVALFSWSRNDPSEVSWKIPDHNATAVKTTGTVPTKAPESTPASEAVAENPPAPGEDEPTSFPVPSSAAEPSVPPAVIPVPAPSPTPSDSELAGPLPTNTPESKPANPAPAAQVSPVSETPDAVPQPTPASDAAGLALQPQFWPAQVTLLSPVRFPVIINGTKAGNVQAPRGSTVRLRKIDAGGILELERAGATATVSSESTDLIARVQAIAGARHPNAPASSQTPTANTAD